MDELLDAWLYDGLSAVRRDITVRLAGAALIIVETGEAIPLDRLESRGDRTSIVYGHADREGWRLGLPGGLPESWRSRLPRQEHHGALLDRYGIIRVVVVCAILAAAALFGLWKGAEIAARLVPESWEMALGESVTGDFGGSVCKGRAGQDALDRLAIRLSTDGRPVTVRVIDRDMVNAIALPGRQVILFSGLLDKAKTPDEVAGVLGHEIGHVANRDVMAGLIRSFGLSLLIGGADGGAIAQTLITSRYSRATETSADGEALARLARANISPAPTATFFGRLAQVEDGLGHVATALSYVASHPLSREREQRFAQAAQTGHVYQPALAPADWRALRAICRKSLA